MTQPASTTHVVVIPSFDTGATVYDTVRAARAAWQPVYVVVDGSRDGSAEGLQAMARDDTGLRVWVLPHNQGKGAAVLHGLQAAQAAGFSHALTMDADGQHPAQCIGAFMQASRERPDAMILGRPVFDASAPLLRVRGRRVSNWWTNLETLGAGVDDSLFGFKRHCKSVFITSASRITLLVLLLTKTSLTLPEGLSTTISNIPTP